MRPVGEPGEEAFFQVEGKRQMKEIRLNCFALFDLTVNLIFRDTFTAIFRLGFDHLSWSYGPVISDT